MVKKGFIFLILLLGICVLNSCDKRKLIEEEHHTVNEPWSYDDGVSFTLNCTDTTTWYDMDLEVSHTDDYGYQNLYIITETTYPNQEIVKSQVNMDLAQSSGEWLGSCSGKACTIPIAFAKKFKFQQLGNHKITLHQNTRDSLLNHITGLTLKLYEWRE